MSMVGQNLGIGSLLGAKAEPMASKFPNRMPGDLDRLPMTQELAVQESKLAPTTETPLRMDAPEVEEAVDNLNHRQALQQFLKRMKDEFNLDAEQIVKAFSELSSDELLQAPELNLDKLIQALPLNPEQQVMAKAIFQDMLKQTAAQDMAGYLKASNRQLSLEVLSRNEADKRAVTRAVEQMQSQFFNTQTPQSSTPRIEAAVSRYQNQQTANQPFETGNQPVETGEGEGGRADRADWRSLGMQVATKQDQALFEANAISPAPDAKILKPEISGAPQASAVDVYVPVEAEATELFDAQAESLLTDRLENPVAALNAAPTVAPAPTATPTPTPTPAADMALPGPDSIAFTATASHEGGGEHFEEGEGNSQNGPLGFAQTDAKAPGQSAVQSKESFMITHKATPAEEAGNIREVINNAQVLARKGGGEMKVTLAPEGLGQVKMKVALQNGQVSVEMIADSNEAKKIIEKGLGDLKATLMSHNMKVDQIRVDTPADISNQMSEQHDRAQRQFAQQFMEQFRQENNEFRRGFFDISTARRYGSQKEEAERHPVTASNNNRRANGSRRLDLVA